MKEIQRYKVLSGGFIVEQSDGSLVEYDDHTAIVAALQEQVQKLAAEADYLRDEIKQHSESVHFCEVCGKDDPCKNDDVCYALSHPLPATDAVIREIGAKAVEEYSKTVGAEKNGAIYAAKLRAGEVS